MNSYHIEIHRNTISLWIKRYKLTKSIDIQKGSGRSKKTNGDSIQKIIKYVDDNPKKSYRTYVRMWMKKLTRNCQSLRCIDV